VDVSSLDVTSLEVASLEITSVKVDKVDHWNLKCLFAPCEKAFVLTLGESGDTLGAVQSFDEGLYLFVFERSAETVEDDGVGCGENEFVFLGVGVVEKKRIFYLSVVVRDVFFGYHVAEGRGSLLYFQTVVHSVTYYTKALNSIF
jgi:hypothetical protein